MGDRVLAAVARTLHEGIRETDRRILELTNWLEEHEYESLDQARGSMSQQRSPDPQVYERANYIHLLRSWTAEG